MTLTNLGSLPVWLRLAAVLVICGWILAAWKWAARTAVNLEDFAAWFAAHRHAWYALPAVMLAFVLSRALRNPSPGTFIVAAMFVVVPLTLALLINFAFRRLRPAA